MNEMLTYVPMNQWIKYTKLRPYIDAKNTFGKKKSIINVHLALLYYALALTFILIKTFISCISQKYFLVDWLYITFKTMEIQVKKSVTIT